MLAVLPAYRKSFVEELTRLSAKHGLKLQFMAGDVHLDPSVRSSRHRGVDYVSNKHLIGRRLLWQPSTAKAGFEASVAIIDLNPRSLSAWLILVVRKCTGRRTLVWGHVNPRAGQGSFTAPLRRFMRRQASGVITYTWSDASQVRAEDRTSSVWVAANGLYPRAQIGNVATPTAHRILYVGRMEAAKRPELAVKAFALALPQLPLNTTLTLIGSGSELDSLREQVARLGIESRVEMLGHIDEYENLRHIYAESVVSLSPGYAGLSLTQSLGFGVPMLVADDEPHAPEIELLTSKTGAFFPAREHGALAKRLVDVFEGRLTWQADKISDAVRNRYSSTAMAEGFISAILREEPEDSAKQS